MFRSRCVRSKQKMKIMELDEVHKLSNNFNRHCSLWNQSISQIIVFLSCVIFWIYDPGMNLWCLQVCRWGVFQNSATFVTFVCRSEMVLLLVCGRQVKRNLKKRNNHRLHSNRRANTDGIARFRPRLPLRWEQWTLLFYLSKAELTSAVFFCV